jgi:hypothetical protein
VIRIFASRRNRVAGAIADQLRAELRAALVAYSDQLREALRGELAQKVVLEPGRRMQFEVDPFFYGITTCASEEPVLEDWLDSSLPTDWFDRAEEALGGWDELITPDLSKDLARFRSPGPHGR